MLAYRFDEVTKEYLWDQEVQQDPKSKNYDVPQYCTFTPVPEIIEDGYVYCYINDDWQQVVDHRGHWQVKLDDVTFSKVDYLGEAQTGYQFITDEVYADYQADNDKYKVVDGVFTDISGTEEYREIKRQKELERVANLTCTKRELVLMLQELQYSWKDTIRPLIYANDNAALEWELCVELQRKNPLLNLMGSQLGISPEQIDTLFKYANGEVESLEVE